MAKCDLCLSIVVDKRGEQGHDLLEALKRPVRLYSGNSPVIHSHLACTQCGTKWRYEDDETDKYAGWRAVA
jgi:hypothetical protein